MLDRLAKVAALRSLAAGQSAGALRLVENERPLLSPSIGRARLVALWALAVACAAIAVQSLPASGSRGLVALGLAISLAGAAGNLIDRVRRGAVIDFIAFPWWPAFNLADVAIVLGALLALGALI
jgi:signal peptidase II